MTPRPYQPGCPKSFEQWQKSEGNRIKALTIRKDKSSQGPLQDHIRPFGSSSYAANMTLAAIDYEVQRQVESARCFSMEQEIKQRVQRELQRASCYAAKSNPYPLLEWDEDHVSGEVFQHQPYAFKPSQMKPPSDEVRFQSPILLQCILIP